MTHAVALAARGTGTVSPGALVGAVILGPDGDVWGEGWYGRYGGPHAEVWAVRDAEARGFGSRLREATLVVTLEPCSHWGKTPPCADLVVRTGVARVVVAHADPFPAVAGQGIARIRAAGIPVDVGEGEQAARDVNAAFLTHVATRRPLVTLKVAATLDGQVATHTGGQPVGHGPRGARARPRLARRGRRRARRGRDGARRRPGADHPRCAARAGRTGSAPRRPRPPRARSRLPSPCSPTGRARRSLSSPPAPRRLTLRPFGRPAEPSGRSLKPAAASASARSWTRSARAAMQLGRRFRRTGRSRSRSSSKPVRGSRPPCCARRLADRIRWFVAPKLVGAGRSDGPPRRRRDGPRARLRPARAGRLSARTPCSRRGGLCADAPFPAHRFSAPDVYRNRRRGRARRGRDAPRRRPPPAPRLLVRRWRSR